MWYTQKGLARFSWHGKYRGAYTQHGMPTFLPFQGMDPSMEVWTAGRQPPATAMGLRTEEQTKHPLAAFRPLLRVVLTSLQHSAGQATHVSLIWRGAAPPPVMVSSSGGTTCPASRSSRASSRPYRPSCRKCNKTFKPVPRISLDQDAQEATNPKAVTTAQRLV